MRKKWYEKILIALMEIVFSPFFILYFLVYFFYIFLISPIEKRKYKKSAYFHKYNEKYINGITKTSGYKLLNHLAEQGSQVVMVSLDYGYSYLYNESTLFIYIYGKSLYFNKESMKWIVTMKPEYEMTLDDYIELELTYVSSPFNRLSVMLLVDFSIINNNDYDKAASNKSFIIYHDVSDLACILGSY